jgi:hypothetical protein
MKDFPATAFFITSFFAGIGIRGPGSVVTVHSSRVIDSDYDQFPAGLNILKPQIFTKYLFKPIHR